MTILPHIRAMAFTSDADFPTSFGFAERFAGEDGHVATLPEIVSARAKNSLDSALWNTWYTTASAEYIGTSRTGVPIIIVAHGVGPMATLEGIDEAYRPRAVREDGRPDDHGQGMISLEQFRMLESGHYGEVEIVEISKILAAYPSHEYTEPATMDIAERDPLLHARMGADWRAVLEPMAKETRTLRSTTRTAPLVIDNNDATMYWHPQYREGTVQAHLLTVGRPMHVNGQDCYFEVSCSQRSNYQRFIGVRSDGDIAKTHRGPDELKDHKEWLVAPLTEPAAPADFLRIDQFGDKWFTMTAKPKGATLDTSWPEYPVSVVELYAQKGRAVEIDPYVYFRYDIDEVRAQAPEGANAYFLSGGIVQTKIDGENAGVAEVSFCKVTLDTTRRVVLQSDFDANFDLQMQLLEQRELATAGA